MSVIKITGTALKRGLGYVSCSVGTQASAKQDVGLLYFETISDDEAMLQIQEKSSGFNYNARTEGGKEKAREPSTTNKESYLEIK